MALRTAFSFQVIFSVAALYVLVAQLIYCYRKVRCNQCTTIPNQVSIMITVTSGVAFIYGVLESVESYLVQFVDTIPHHVFGTLFSLTSGLYALSLTTVYSILWLRQRGLYNKPTLSHLTNQFSRFLSKYLIVFIVVFGVVALMLTVIADWLEICRGRCLVVLTIVTLFVIPAIVQLLLVTLFVLPLLKHRKTNHAAAAKYIPLTQRIAGLTVICLITDVTTALLSVFLLEPAILGINLISNLLCVIFTTLDWKDRLFPYKLSTNPTGIQSETDETELATTESTRNTKV